MRSDPCNHTWVEQYTRGHREVHCSRCYQCSPTVMALLRIAKQGWTLAKDMAEPGGPTAELADARLRELGTT